MQELSRISINIEVKGLGTIAAELVRFLAPRTVESIVRALPLEGKAAIWKEEVYFEIPVKTGSEKPSEKVQTGTLAYWPMGSAFCIFYGKSQPYSAVNNIGSVKGDIELFRSVKDGMTVRLEKVS